MNRKSWGISGIFLIILAVAAWRAGWFVNAPGPQASVPPTDRGSAATLSANDPEFLKMPTTSDRRTTWNVFEPMPSGEKRSNAILRLTASARQGNANDAMAAFRLADECVQGQKMDKQPLQPGTQPDAGALKEIEDRRRAMHSACDDVSPVLRADRFANLQVALDAGMAEAMLAYATSGPNGDMDALATRPDDPDVAAWRQNMMTYLGRAAELGNRPAMWQLANTYRDGTVVAPDPQKVVVYETALLDIYKANDFKPALIEVVQNIADEEAALLTPEARQAARQEGDSLAQRCCTPQKRGKGG